MRPSSSRVVILWIAALCLLAVLFSLDGLVSAQTAAESKRKLSQHALLSQRPLVSGASAQKTKPNAPPPLTADSWTGLSGDNNWGTAGNWTGGVPTGADAVTIGAASVDVNMNVNGGVFGTLALSNSGDELTVPNGFALNADGNITNNGTVMLNSAGGTTELVLQSNVILSGSGTVTLSNNFSNYILGAASTDTLTNQETISGAGQIGDGQMTLVNSGTINSNQTAGMTVFANGGVTNTGTIEATAGATLLFENMGPQAGTTGITNTGVTISANASELQVTATTITGGTVTLTGASTLQLDDGTIQGGTLTNSATGMIEAVASVNTLGGTINNSAGGLVNIENGAVLQLQTGTYAQLGTVQLNSAGAATELEVLGNVTLSGGTVTLSNNFSNYILGAASTDTLTNQETISGAGQIADGQMTLVNSGTINSNQTAGMTVFANGGVTNTGTIEATAGATLLLENMGPQAGTTGITNTGGTISANASELQVTATTITGGTVTLTGASTLQLDDGTIQGGTLTNSATGTIEAVASVNTLGGTINNSAGGLVNIENGAVLKLQTGTYAQLGTVQLHSAGRAPELEVLGNVTLSGGTVTLSNNFSNYILGAASTDTLTNQETISGAGQIGDGQMTLVNSGTINSNQTAGMTIFANGGVTNTGTIEATAGATLLLEDMGPQAGTTGITNTGGTISANASELQVTATTITGGTVTLTGASTLQLDDGTIQGGTLTNSATGTIEAVASVNTLGGTINNSAGGLVNIENGAVLQLQTGTYAQLGTVQLNSAGAATELEVLGNVTLSGGTVTLSNNFSNHILGAASTDTLTNQETISGAGHIGNGQMTLVNSGTINANASDNLIINVGTATVNNTGTLEAAGGTLTIEGSGTTFFTNDNQTTNTLTGGTYIANRNNIQWAAGTDGIKTLSANVTEENGGQLINTTNSSNALANLTSITSAGALTIGGVAFTDAGSFSNAGSLTLLSGESFTIGSLNQISNGRLTAGTYVLDANLDLSGTAQTITVNAANLTLAGGTIENTSNSTNALAGLASNTGKLTIGGTSNAVSTTASSFSNAGTLTIDAGDSFTAHRLTQISSGTLTAGTYVLGGNLDLSTTRLSVITNAANLTLQGGTIKSGSANALAALANNTGSLTIAGANHAISTTAASFSNTGMLTID